GTITNVKKFVQTFLNPPGKIVIRGEDVVLPRGLCTGDEQAMPLGDLKHAYLLRRAIPWNTSGPVLVIETRRGVFEDERDWFPLDGDQRLVAATLNRRVGRAAGSSFSPSAPSSCRSSLRPRSASTRARRWTSTSATRGRASRRPRGRWRAGSAAARRWSSRGAGATPTAPTRRTRRRGPPTSTASSGGCAT